MITSHAKALVWNIKSFPQLTASDLHKILQVRTDVFIVEQNCPYREVDGSDPEAVHLWAEQDTQIVAYCRIFRPGIKYSEASIGRVLTHPAYRRLQFGKILMSLAIQVISSRYGLVSIRISAQDYLLKFYKDLGFQATDHHYLEDNIPHTEMVKN